MTDEKQVNAFEELFRQVNEVVSKADELPFQGKSVVLFRAALDAAEEEVGLFSAVHLMSRLLTSTLSAIAEEDNFGSSFEDILSEWDQSTTKPN
jgi:hypothetical protein|tara:strand:- start:1215 stop:1496 length:282 start_codon:yes stop_codon:yes gene_type:complete